VCDEVQEGKCKEA